MGRYPERPGRCSAAPARTHWECNPNPTLKEMRAQRGEQGAPEDTNLYMAIVNFVHGYGGYGEDHEEAFDN